MRVLLTGATGFLGRQLLPLLDTHQVLCLSRDPTRVPRRPGVRAISADLGHAGDWLGEVEAFRPEWCLHLAWEGLPDYSLDRCRVNLDAGIRLLGALSQSGATRLVVAGSCWEYGRASGAVSEEITPVDPDTFAATKLAYLSLLKSVARESGFEYRWARVFFVYGPNQRQSSLIPSLRAACLANRTPDIREAGAMQDFVHVDDIAAGLLALAESGTSSGVFNLGSGRPTSVAQVANLVADYYGRKRPFEPLPVSSGFWAATSKVLSATRWCTRIDIDEGIERTLATLDGSR